MWDPCRFTNMTYHNLQAYKYNEAIHKGLLEGCGVLNHFNITSFRYFRVFEDGKYLNLSTNSQWLLERLQIPDNGSSMSRAMQHASLDKTHQYLWPVNSEDVILSHMRSHGICNGFTLYKRLSDNSVEAWSFSSSPNDSEMQNFYMNNVNIIRDFITYFNSKFHTLIKPAKDNLASFENEVDITPIEDVPLHFSTLINDNDKFLAQYNGEQNYLTAREYDSLRHMSLGKTCKETARILGISNRTVECYVAKVKQKFTLSQKSELIDLFMTNFVN